jgi:hypothetical protein
MEEGHRVGMLEQEDAAASDGVEQIIIYFRGGRFRLGC